MHIFRALLLSSQRKAAYVLYGQSSLWSFPVEKYRLVVEERDGYTVLFYRVRYASGNASQTEMDKEPYRIEKIEEKDKLYNWLRRYMFDPDTGWIPVE